MEQSLADSGQFVETAARGERVRAFLPPPLPPTPPLDLQGLFTLYDTARGAVGRLDGVTTILPSTPLFLYMYVRKEAAAVVSDRGHAVLALRSSRCSRATRFRTFRSTTWPRSRTTSQRWSMG